ncbi:hypothetical protein DRP53_06575 [candidate division WOR-3 bacterium]|uniref:DUF3160 domain-containing protein n=1 Tax=candidate division WOR-3 bacterium TaxID=2052148 RepID=A0A660SGM9_UNCW3|nr:MAG: hypothetical protein DRP53_06575 [candidate division WOR-3 bacterium]
MMKFIPLFSLLSVGQLSGGSGLKIEPTDYTQFYELYKDLRKEGKPIFVSQDAILHTFHLLYDYSLRDLESHRLYFMLDTLLDLMLDKTRSLLPRYPEARYTFAYFATAKKLLSSAYEVDPMVKSLVQAELSLIQEHKGFARSPIFGTKEDYSQFVPRGHYTRSERLRSYFLAMAYLGRMGFYLHPREEELARSHIIRSLLIMACLKGKARRLWRKIYKITTLYAGRSDDLTPDDYEHLIDKEFPGGPLKTIDNPEELNRFIKLALKLRRPKIISTWTRDDEDAYLTTLSFKFLGQRFIPDGYIFQNLVYNKVGTRTHPRLFPKGLDILAVLGSARAESILINHYHEDRYLNYKENLIKLKKEFGDLDESEWNSNIYWGWLRIIKEMIIPPKAGPRIFRSRAWIDKTLTTGLAFWAELRHDAILYAKQSYTVAVSVRPKPRVGRAYLEPRPEVYRRLKLLAEKFPRSLLSSPTRDLIDGYIRLLDRLIEISQFELAGKDLSREDIDLLYNIGGILENLSSLPSNQPGYSRADRTIELIADVHTDVNTRKALEVGVGKVDLITLRIDRTTYYGGSFSYYEFLQPISHRLTDEEWQRMKKPKRPDWQ